MVILGYPLVICYSLRTWKWPIEIVDLPNLKMVIVHSYVNIYQRVKVWFWDIADTLFALFRNVGKTISFLPAMTGNGYKML